MPYSPVEDIPGMDTSQVDIQERDPRLRSVIDATEFAVSRSGNFKKEVEQPAELRAILTSQLLLYVTTYRSMRVILSHAYNTSDYTLVPDASSLVREQIEKIYIISLFLDNPTKWILRYSTSGWRTDYERYRLELEEYGDIERHQEFLTKHFPEYLENTRVVKIGKRTEVIVSDFAKEALKHKWDYPGDKKPSWFIKAPPADRKEGNTIREFVRNYFDFPTPGSAAAEITDPDLRAFLYRWHKEYSYVCQYSHVAFGKILIPTMSEYKDSQTWDKTVKNGTKLADQTVFLSQIAAATSCALILNSLKNTYGVKAELRDFWKELRESSLPANAFWNMYVESILK